MPVNVYPWDFFPRCLNCLCFYCVSTHCPFGRVAFSNKNNFCDLSLDRGSCPRLICDFFVHRELHPRKYVVVKREVRQGRAILKLIELDKDIQSIKKLLEEKNR